MPTYSDYQDEALQRQLAYSDALRKQSMGTGGQMVSGIYVPKSPWANVAEGFASGYMGGNATQGQKDLQTQRDQLESRWLAQKPATTEAVWSPEQKAADVSAGPLPDAPANVQALPYATQVQNAQNWATKAPPHSALGQTLRAAAAAQAFTGPEKLLERQEAADARSNDVLTRAKEAAALSAEHDRRLAEARTEFERIRLEDKEAARQLNEAREANMLRLAASLRQPAIQLVHTVDAEGKPVDKFVPKVAGSTIVPTPPASERKADRQGKELAGEVNTAIAKVEQSPDAFGLKTFVPSWALSRASTDKEIDARAVVGALKSAKIKDMSGTAVSSHEQERLNEFLPAKGENAATVVIKLRAFRDELARKGYIVEGSTADDGFSVNR